MEPMLIAQGMTEEHALQALAKENLARLMQTSHLEIILSM